MTIKQRQLNPIEATAYWWVSNIKHKVRELYESKKKDDKEVKFLELFCYFNDLKWREIYLEIIRITNERINNTFAEDTSFFYQQQTSVYSHDDINEALSIVLNQDVPDINLSLNGIGDSSICTNTYGADRLYAEGGMSSLDSDFDSNYVLSGDMQEFEVKSLIMMLLRANEDNTSYEKLKCLFMTAYLNMHPSCNKLIIEAEFARIFDQLCDEQLVSSLLYEKEYQTKLDDFNLKNIDSLGCISPFAIPVKEYCKKGKH